MRLLILSVLLLFASAQRLPAPIQEIPETPSPSPRSAPKQPRPKATATAAKPATVQAKSGNLFAGSWHGSLPFGMAGTITPTLAVNQDGTAVTESGGLVAPFTASATNNGKTVSWRTGAVNEMQWTLTPASDGKTAVVRVHGNMFIGDHTATFQKVSK